MKYIVGGLIVLPDRVAAGKALAIDGGKIAGIVDTVPEGAETIDAKGGYVTPGLIDIHVHGYMDADTCDADPEGIRRMANGVAANGVTSFLPTTMTVSEQEIRASIENVRALMPESKGWDGAEILGVHAEGPFINPKKKGAQAAENIKTPDAEFFREYKDVVRIITLAPEMDEGHKAIKQLAAEGFLVSMGHTDADYDEAVSAVADGVAHVTHLFNACTALAHRNPGVVGAAFNTDVTVEMIADTFHINPALFSIVARLKSDKLVLITDCTRAGGMPDGEYELGGQPIYLKGIECRLADGTIAGSVLRLNVAVRNMLEHTSLPVHEVVAMVTSHPAKAIKAAGKGVLDAGYDADIAIFDKDWNTQATIKYGKVIYSAQ